MTFQTPPPNFNVVLEVFDCEGATTSTLILGGAEIMLEGRRMFRIVLSSAGFPNFCHNLCPALVGISNFKLEHFFILVPR